MIFLYLSNNKMLDFGALRLRSNILYYPCYQEKNILYCPLPINDTYLDTSR